jgi:hypothetical protein
MAIAGDGRVTKQRWLTVGPAYDGDGWGLTAGPDGLYAGTHAVGQIPVQQTPDELLRIDPKSLAIVAKTRFPLPASFVAAVATGQGLWVTLGDGHVLRLDPRTLAVLASRRLIPKPKSWVYVSAPAIGAGSLWVEVDDGHGHFDLVRLDPRSLAVRSRTPLANYENLVSDIATGGDGVYLWGRNDLVGGIVRVDAQGAIEGRPISEPNLESLAVDGPRLVALVGGRSDALVELDLQGQLLARSTLRGVPDELVVSGRDAWFGGDAGGGSGVVHVRLNLP